MNPDYYKDTGLLKTQVQDMTMSQGLDLKKQLLLITIFPTVERILKSFSQRDQDIFTLAYLADERKTCRELSKMYNISPQRVSQIQRRILNILQYSVSRLDLDL